MAPTIVIAVSDLMFQSRIEAAARGLGGTVFIADTAERFHDALAGRPALVVIDVHETAFDANDAITRAVASGARVLGFGRHTAPTELRAARAAGADSVVPRSDLVDKLPELLQHLLPVPETEGL